METNDDTLSLCWDPTIPHPFGAPGPVLTSVGHSSGESSVVSSLWCCLLLATLSPNTQTHQVLYKESMISVATIDSSKY